MRDAFSEASFRAWFFEGFRTARAIESDDALWKWRRIGSGATAIDGVDGAVSTLLAREQSNTSVVYDDQVIAKVFRKLERGVNPDVEIGVMFSEHDANVATPRVIGEVVREDSAGETVVAILQQYVHNVGDGWGWMLKTLASDRDAALEGVRQLGARTAEMHLALAFSSSDPAFAPESFDERDLTDMQSRLEREVEVTFDGLRAAGADDPGRLKAIEAALRGLATRLDPFLGSRRIRVHGDYHLGQVLRTVEHDFRIIDFEGEPSRPMAQRRLKWPALRDVAGMLRSLDYAAETVARGNDAPGSFADWLASATDVFVDAYRAGVGDGKRLWPDDKAAFDFALPAVIIEKALYEARYELNNRPDWLPIPYAALVRLSGVR
jgi:trehalose synthase-fused probable maltokinase